MCSVVFAGICLQCGRTGIMFSMRFRMRLDGIRSFHPAVQVSSYKISVIPQSVYRGDDVNLKVENEVKIPLWLYKKDENGSIDDARFFYLVISEKRTILFAGSPIHLNWDLIMMRFSKAIQNFLTIV